MDKIAYELLFAGSNDYSYTSPEYYYVTMTAGKSNAKDTILWNSNAKDVVVGQMGDNTFLVQSETDVLKITFETSLPLKETKNWTYDDWINCGKAVDEKVLPFTPDNRLYLEETDVSKVDSNHSYVTVFMSQNSNVKMTPALQKN